MDRSIIQEHLAMAERHVVQGEEHLARQRAVIEELARDGHDTAKAEALLRQFEHAQKLHVSERERLRDELRNAS